MEKRLSDKVENLLNKQIKIELDSSLIYKAMSIWMDQNGLDGGKKLFSKYSDEEMRHLDRITEYLSDNNCNVTIQSSDVQKVKYDSLEQLFNISLKHEYDVTDSYKQLAKILRQSDEDLTYKFIQYYLKEQVEEEKKFTDLIDRLGMCGSSIILMDEIMDEMAG